MFEKFTFFVKIGFFCATIKNVLSVYKNKCAFVLILWFLGSCSSTNNPQNKLSVDASLKTWQPPAPGIDIAQIEERITEDKLNKKYFKVFLTATDSSNRGFYLLTLTYAFSKNQTVIAFPKWSNGAYPKPVLKKGNASYQALLGFDSGDGSFHPYYDINVKSNTLTLEKTNDYVLGAGG